MVVNKKKHNKPGVFIPNRKRVGVFGVVFPNDSQKSWELFLLRWAQLIAEVTNNHLNMG